MSSLDQHVILIIGASSGIGEGIARELAKFAAKSKDSQITLHLAARRVDRLNKLLSDVKDNPETGTGINHEISRTFELDVTDKTAVQELYNQIKKPECGGGVDVVINCAGVMYFQLLKNQHWDQWERQIDVNCKGTVYSCGAALASMLEKIKKERNSNDDNPTPPSSSSSSSKNKKTIKHIINISSDAARQTFPALTIYNASKRFVSEYSKGLRCECVGTGIRVTDIQPGDVRGTDLVRTNTDAEAAGRIGVDIGTTTGGDDDDGVGFDDQSTKRAYYLDPEDVAGAVIYALTAPSHVGVHEILIEPRDQMFGDPTSLDVSF